jgi:hypothetical protein
MRTSDSAAGGKAVLLIVAILAAAASSPGAPAKEQPPADAVAAARSILAALDDPRIGARVDELGARQAGRRIWAFSDHSTTGTKGHTRQ